MIFNLEFSATRAVYFGAAAQMNTHAGLLCIILWALCAMGCLHYLTLLLLNFDEP